jgi:hypothetical protein
LRLRRKSKSGDNSIDPAERALPLEGRAASRRNGAGNAKDAADFRGEGARAVVTFA